MLVQTFDGDEFAEESHSLGEGQVDFAHAARSHASYENITSKPKGKFGRKSAAGSFYTTHDFSHEQVGRAI